MNNFLPVIFFTFSVTTGLNGIYSSTAQPAYSYINVSKEDTLDENQILFNGRLWRNLYNKIKEDQFLFSKDFLPGSITIGGETFKDVSVRYDIYNDEIMTPTNHGLILRLNKEMVDSFSINFQNTNWHFTKIPEDSVKILKGYVNVLYSGKSSLYVRYKKEVELLAVDRKYDRFYQTHKIYFVKDNIVYLVSGKREFFKLMGDDKQQVRNFIKKNKLSLSRVKPESFVPVIQFYDSLKQ